MKIEIACRFSGSVLFAHEQDENTLKLTVEAAVKARANLTGADLTGAYLAGANLDGAYLDGANLGGASLAGANLAGASLAGANLVRANLDGANLDGANLDGANLDGETLTKTPLSLLNLTWPVLITEGYMRIGCQRHTHSEWADFDTDAIKNMDSSAAKFWLQWRDVLLVMCKQHSGG